MDSATTRLDSARTGGLGTALVFAGAVIVAGGNAVAIRVSNRELDALFGAAARFAAAALVFVVIMALMAVGAALLAIASVASGERWAVPAAPSTWVALGFLVVSTVAIFAAFLFVLRRWSASATSYQFLLIPIPAVVLSALIDAEPLTPGLAVGGLLVLAGSWMGMRPWKGRSAAPQTKSATMISTSSRRMSRSRSSSRT